jgi:hypothetical protein
MSRRLASPGCGPAPHCLLFTVYRLLFAVCCLLTLLGLWAVFLLFPAFCLLPTVFGGGQDVETRITKRFAHLLVGIERKVNDPYIGK